MRQKFLPEQKSKKGSKSANTNNDQNNVTQTEHRSFARKSCNLIYLNTRKSNPFHRFLNGLTQSVYSVFQP